MRMPAAAQRAAGAFDGAAAACVCGGLGECNLSRAHHQSQVQGNIIVQQRRRCSPSAYCFQNRGSKSTLKRFHYCKLSVSGSMNGCQPVVPAPRPRWMLTAIRLRELSAGSTPEGSSEAVRAVAVKKASSTQFHIISSLRALLRPCIHFICICIASCIT